MTVDPCEQVAEDLRAAARDAVAVAPVREVIGATDIETAYAVQDVNTHHVTGRGARIVGRKIGLTSVDVQAQLGVDQPDFGMLFDYMDIPNEGTISTSGLIAPRIEAEIALVMGGDLTRSNVTTAEAISAVDYAVAALEIIDCRIAEWDISIVDTIADNAAASHFVLGHTPRRLTDLDIAACTMDMRLNDERVSTGTGRDCLGSPLNALRWLAARMAERNRPLRRGDVVLTGALGPTAAVRAGDRVSARLGPLGEVAVNFS
ncbi:2-keto-4-pentenoate hydratase [Haloglycomyces albus]|uniref:2-keto-4-pentenoate hydratase n=1 Tax=Haloglycomyces albus TaxID=526067 RepID=UPI00046CBEF3|nr:fumarylacetoacetate hydrolase family protein [Haloglycomyces albus]